MAKATPVSVACSNDQKEYVVSFSIFENKIISYAINEGSSWSEEQKIEESTNENEVWVEYVEEYDTHFGYVVYKTKNYLTDWKVKSWTSGNDSDNYEASVNDDKVFCHILLKKPTSLFVESDNIFKKL